MREWWSRFRAWAGGRREIAGNLAEELETHLDMETESCLERGAAPAEARAARVDPARPGFRVFRA